MTPVRPCEESLLCSHSIGRQLSRKLALFTMATLGVLCLATYFSVKMLIVERNTEDLMARCELVATLLKVEARAGGEAAVVARLRSDALMRGHTRLEVEGYLRALRIQAAEDPSNASLEYARNRVRAEVMPALRALNPRAAESIAAFASRQREDDEALTAIAEAWPVQVSL